MGDPYSWSSIWTAACKRVRAELVQILQVCDWTRSFLHTFYITVTMITTCNSVCQEHHSVRPASNLASSCWQKLWELCELTAVTMYGDAIALLSQKCRLQSLKLNLLCLQLQHQECAWQSSVILTFQLQCWATGPLWQLQTGLERPLSHFQPSAVVCMDIL